jgi:alpha-glucosidase
MEPGMTDDWWRGAVLYQIYPRSFMDASGDGIGDLAGIGARLDHVKSLGVEGVWLSPVFRSPMRDFGYDVSDYRDIDPMFGTLADFDALVKAAHDRDLKVIVDQVYAHCSSNHAWFAASRMDRDNPHADWFVWADPKPDGAPPNNWQAWFGGPAWTWEPRRRQYYLHNFLPTQPQFNFHNPDVRKAILSIAEFWLDRGVDGFRLDVANYYFHDRRLRDNPPSGRSSPALPRDMQDHQWNSNQPETLDFIEELRALTDRRGGKMMVGELAPGSQPLMAEYSRGQGRLHTAYAFDFLGAWPGLKRFAEILGAWGEGANDGWPGWAFSNHDVARVATRWGEGIGAPPDLAAPLFLGLLASLRGTIFLYQGEELGLPEAEVPFERLRDPWGIAGWPATKGRDGCRTPMPWTGRQRAGFTTGKPWLPVDPRHLKLSVERQEGRRGAMLEQARAVLALRRADAVLRLGGLQVVTAADCVLALARRWGNEARLCVFNLSGEARRQACGDCAPEALWIHRARLKGGGLMMEPFGGAILDVS